MALWRLNTSQTVGGLRSKLSSIHLTFSSDTTSRPELLPLHRKPYLPKLMIPTTNAVSRWRLNVETKTKRTLYSSRRLSFNELAKAKNLVLQSSPALGESSSDGIWKFRTSSFKCYIDHSHSMCSSGNIDVRNWVNLFESRCISFAAVGNTV